MAIVFYSNNCPKCRILEEKLKQKNISFEKNNDIELMLQKGFMTVPVLEIDGVVYSFKEAIKWIGER